MVDVDEGRADEVAVGDGEVVTFPAIPVNGALGGVLRGDLSALGVVQQFDLALLGTGGGNGQPRLYPAAVGGLPGLDLRLDGDPGGKAALRLHPGEHLVPGGGVLHLRLQAGGILRVYPGGVHKIVMDV